MRNFFKKIVVAILTWEAQAVLRKYQPIVIAVTGNVGKTSTKEAIFSVLKDLFFVRRSLASYNNELGVPLTILGLQSGFANPLRWLVNLLKGFGLIVLRRSFPKILVLEVGADRPGDIRKVAGWLKPPIAVITSLGTTPVHVEFFASPVELAREKRYLVEAVPAEGTVILNLDDENVYAMSRHTRSRVLTYGFEQNATLKASYGGISYDGQRPSGIHFRVDYAGSSVPVQIKGAIGQGQIYSALAALAVGLVFDLNLVAMAEALSSHQSPPGRLKILEGIKDSVIIDDSYNSSPAAARLALSALKELKTTGRKICLLGDMLELGSYSRPEHEGIGLEAAGVCNELITVGKFARFIAEAASEAGMSKENIAEFDEVSEAGEYLEHLLRSGDIVLIKGSQVVRLERAVEEIMAEPERKRELLVRQGPEWR